MVGFLREYTLLQVKINFRSPRTDNGDDAYVVNSYGDVYHGSWDVSHSDGSNFTQIKLMFRSSCTYRDFTVYFVYSDSNVSDGYYDWVVDSYRALRAAPMLTMHTTLTRVVT